ncbi:hypothetical protein Scep_027689 [Stephania cephalantha]|uniref:Uncharacterized protein n=1 Tax=Stephania cephalantha TaxID=152367 RepID=A0AAP0ED18_9MAGN
MHVWRKLEFNCLSTSIKVQMLEAHIGLMFKHLLMMDVLLLVDYSKVNDQKDAQLDESSKGKDDELEESFT